MTMLTPAEQKEMAECELRYQRCKKLSRMAREIGDYSRAKEQREKAERWFTEFRAWSMESVARYHEQQDRRI